MKIKSWKIKLILAECQMQQGDLAEKCGVTRQNISAILARGSCHPKTAGKLASALGVPLSEIVVEED